MTRLFPIRDLLALISLLSVGVGSLAADASGSEISGKRLLENHCSRCHSIEATDESPLKGAPPLREIYLKYPIEELEYGFAEGMGSRHREMPQIQFSTEEVSAILSYLGSIAGRPPSQRLPTNAPRETEPP